MDKKSRDPKVALSLFLATTLFFGPLSALEASAQNLPSSRPASAGQDSQIVDESYYPEKKKSKDEGVVLQGSVTYTVPKGTPIKLKLATVPTSGLHLMDKDFEGNYRPAKLGQMLTAKTTEDIFVDTDRVIPQGTTFAGYVSKIYPPRRVGRPGHLEIQFEKIKLPDGRVFAFRVEADNFKKSTAKSKARGFGRLMAHAAGGGLTGAIIAYQVSGIQTTISMHGYNIAAGAAAGAIAGTTYAILKRGKQAYLEPGDDLNMSIDNDFLMPVATKPTPKKAPKRLDGLDVEILKSKITRDGLGGHLLRLDINLDNNTNRQMRGIDFFLEDSMGNRHPISLAQADEDAESNFSIPPYSVEKLRLHFAVEHPKLKHRMVILDHSSRRPIHVVEIE